MTSILPIVLYAIFGTTRALAVGPVAVMSLMTAAAIGNLADQGNGLCHGGAHAGVSVGCVPAGMDWLFRLGILANFLSHPVISGFITATGVLIAASQLKHILGVQASGDTLIELLTSLWSASRRSTGSRFFSACVRRPFCSGCARVSNRCSGGLGRPCLRWGPRPARSSPLW